jgi:hypothetical protein
VLTANPNEYGQTAQEGALNFYAFDAKSGQTSFIARLSGSDGGLWGQPASTGPINVSTNGEYLAFESYAHLTPDDTSGTAQLFEYDAATGTLVRASIGQNGYNFNGNTDTRPPRISSPSFASFCSTCSNIPGSDAYWERHDLANNGELFFESRDALTPSAVEDPRGLVENVYEYHNGQVYLISDGADIGISPEGESVVRLLGTDQSGDNVFFETADGLVPQDNNEGVDIYDARVDGGIPPPEPAGNCEGDACQGQLAGAPVLLSPASQYQAGGENFQPLQPKSNTPVVKGKALKAKGKKKKKRKNSRKARRSARRARSGARRSRR